MYIHIKGIIIFWSCHQSGSGVQALVGVLMWAAVPGNAA